MEQFYRITPLEKKSVEAFYDVYGEDHEGNIRRWSVTETYRWGQGFRELDDPVYEHNEDIHCDPTLGWGAELDDLCAVFFEFDSTFTEEEKTEIEQAWQESGAGWLFDGEHNWSVEDDFIRIIGPFKIDIVNEDGSMVKDNVEADILDISASTAWPFPVIIGDKQ